MSVSILFCVLFVYGVAALGLTAAGMKGSR